MLLTEQEVDALRKSLPAVCKHQDVIRAAESAVLEKLKAQEQAKEPVGWYFMDDPQVVAMPGSGYFPGRTPPNDAVNLVPLYTHPLPPDDVVRDAERYRWLRDQVTHDGIAIVMKNKHIDDRKSYSENIDNFIDAAMKEMK